MQNKLSFKLKLILSYTFVVFFSFTLVAIFLDKRLEENSLAEIKSSLISQGLLIEEQVSKESIKKEDSDYLDALLKNLGRKINCRLTIINLKGKVLADSDKSPAETRQMENHAGRPEIEEALSGNIGVVTHYSKTLKIDMLYTALPIKDNQQTIGVLRLALPLISIETALSSIRKVVFLVFLIALGFALLSGLIFTSQIIKPLNKIIGISRNYAKGQFARRLHITSKDELGELASTLNAMASDIEEKIREVNAQNQQLKAVFNSMVAGVILIDNSGRILSINPAVENIFGVSAPSCAGRLFLEAIRNNEISEIVNFVLKSAETKSAELTLAWPVKGTFQVSASPIFGNKSVNGCLLVIHDITEIRRLETMRRDFVANASHELKTPLTSIKGFVETLLAGALEDKQNSRSFLEIVQAHTERISNIINDLLELSYLESKYAQLYKSELDLKVLVDKVLLGFRAQLEKSKISAKNCLPERYIVNADAEKITQVFTNLIDNAIKFNKENANIIIYSQDQGSVKRIIVEDSGIGIPEKDIKRIFERFYRVDKARSRELGGTGLGLSIVKHIIELHGGTVGVESTEGLGSRFWFTL